MFDLRQYISLLESSEIKTINKKVDTKYEIAAITSKIDGTFALLFDNIDQTQFRLVSNLLGTKQRFAKALNTTPRSINDKIFHCIKTSQEPQIIETGLFMENQSSNISELPIVTHFEKESGPFITSSIIHVQNPETKQQNSSFHRMMPIDDTHFSVRMVQQRHLDRCFQTFKQNGEDLPVAITIGVHPAVSIAAAYQEVWGCAEINLANSLLENKLGLTKLPNGISVPSHTEIVMEGKILQDTTHDEWMVEMLKTYDHKRPQPVFELTQLYYRDKPIYHDILSGYSEHRLLMGMPIEAKINNSLGSSFSQVTNVVLTNGGCNWLHAVVQIKKTPQFDIMNLIKKTFESHRSLKQVIIVDDDIDPNSATQVEYAMATRFQADKDMLLIKNVRGSSLDPSSDQENLKTTKLGIDATIPIDKKPEGFELAKIPYDINIDDY